MLPKLVELIPSQWHPRLILGVSTGTLDDQVALAIEPGTAPVSKRLASLHWLQDRGFRTFGMICPSLPQEDYAGFAAQAAAAIRVDRCEHVWAEVLNTRGSSMIRTLGALLTVGLLDEADRLQAVSGPGTGDAWEHYAQETFLAHAKHIPSAKLRFLQYVAPDSADWWSQQACHGAVLLGRAATPPPKGVI